MFFKNRIDAGRKLANSLKDFAMKKPIIFGLPRGGVPVASEVAKALHSPLDVIIVRKLGVPWQPELAFGAIGEGGEKYLNHNVIEDLSMSDTEQSEIENREQEEIKKRQIRFRGKREPLDVAGKTVIIVDDGIATGATIQVACKVAKARGAGEIIVAAPVATKEALDNLKSIADQTVVLDVPENFYAVGQWYEDFTATTDEDVARIFEASRGNYGNTN